MNIGVVIPAFNEEEYLMDCLDSLKQACIKIKNHEISIKILVVLDSCTDHSLQIVKNAEIDYLECDFQCVGKARDLGIRHFIRTGIDWIACTDADSIVNHDWFLQQLEHQPIDAICGIVEIKKWNGLSEQTKQEYLQHYQDKMQHTHIHGANLCFSSQAYLKAGGFQPIICHEDVELVKSMEKIGLNIIWSNKLRVTTSSRLTARAPEGFAHFLKNLELMNNYPAEILNNS